MPHLSNPLLLSDWLTASIESGGMVGVLALNGLFVLVTQYGLEYPQFYARLYTLLQVRSSF
jgi:U3 small nucleolar RNA-associated protein 19